MGGFSLFPRRKTLAEDIAEEKFGDGDLPSRLGAKFLSGQIPEKAISIYHPPAEEQDLTPEQRFDRRLEEAKRREDQPFEPRSIEDYLSDPKALYDRPSPASGNLAGEMQEARTRDIREPADLELPPAKPIDIPNFGRQPVGYPVPPPPTRLEDLQSQIGAIDRPSMRNRILRAIIAGGGIGLAGAFGGTAGAAGAAEAVGQGYEQERQTGEHRRQTLQQEMENERNRQERTQERQMTLTQQMEALKQAASEGEKNRQARITAAGVAKPKDTQTMLGPDGKPHIMEKNPQTGAYDVDRGIAYEKPPVAIAGRDVPLPQAVADQRQQIAQGAKTTPLDQEQADLEVKVANKTASEDDVARLAAIKRTRLTVPAFQAGAQGPARETARSDKSYQFHSSALDKLQTPIDQRAARLGNLQDALTANSPQADALIGPELLTVMAGGQGSGLRMNEAEIQRIVGGRSKWESLKAAANKWQADPSKALSITPAQRGQIQALVKTVASRLQQKQAALVAARKNLIDNDDPKAHRAIYASTQQILAAIDSGQLKLQRNGATDQQRYSTDGGKTWQMGNPLSQ